MNFGHRG